jgi:DDE domain
MNLGNALRSVDQRGGMPPLGGGSRGISGSVSVHARGQFRGRFCPGMIAPGRGARRMECVACGGAATSERPDRTAQGYRRFRCRDCGKQFNERTGGSLNRTQYSGCYLYRAIDRTGALVDVMLSESRDMAAAEEFFRSAKAVTGVTPARVTTDGHDSYPRAIRSQLGADVRHRNSQYLNNRIEQDHRGIKSRIGPMRGFGSVSSAARFFRCHDELRNLLHTRFRQTLPAAARRRRFLQASRICPPRWPRDEQHNQKRNSASSRREI